MPFYFGRTKDTLFFDNYGKYGNGNKKYHIRESNFAIGYVGDRFSLCFFVFNHHEEGDVEDTRGNCTTNPIEYKGKYDD